MIPAFLAPVLMELASKGLSILTGAVLAKGKDAVEKTLGVSIPDDVEQLTPELVAQLRVKEMEHSQALLQMSIEKQKIDIQQDTQANEAVTARWVADMNSTSWLANNIRPIVLIYILSAFTLFAILSASGYNMHVAYIELLSAWGMLVMSAYFVGRTVEKVTTTIQDSKVLRK